MFIFDIIRLWMNGDEEIKKCWFVRKKKRWVRKYKTNQRIKSDWNRDMKIRKEAKVKVIIIDMVPCRLIEVASIGFLVGRVTSDLNSLISPSGRIHHILKSYDQLAVLLFIDNSRSEYETSIFLWIASKIQLSVKILIQEVT